MTLRPALTLAVTAVLSACFTPTDHWKTVTLEPAVTLGAPQGPGSFAAPPDVGPPLPGGHWVAWTDQGPADSTQLFDSTGRYLGPLAPVGDAAGQLRHVQQVVRGAGDSVVVIASGKVSIFDGHLRWVRAFSIPMTSVNSAAELANGWLALASPGQATTLVDRSGKVVGTLEATDPGQLTRRYVQTGVLDAIWTASAVGKLEVDRWDTAGLRSELIPLTREWWPEHSTVAATGEQMPMPLLNGFWRAVPDQLWLAATIASTGKPGAGLIEATDLKHGTILARTEFDQPFGSVVAPGLVSRARRDAGGGWVVDVYRVGMK